MPIYNKLVRDKIIDIIEKKGVSHNFRILDDLEYYRELKKKLYEEVNEFEQTTNESDTLEELADILELIHAVLKVHNMNFESLEAVRMEKLEQRGGFDKRLFLIDVED